jgi:signal transduction histidine kinase
MALVLAGAAASVFLRIELGLPLVGLLAALVVLLTVRILVLVHENRGLFKGFAETDAFKTQLLRFISHEIANPLSPLKVQVGLLKAGAARDLGRAWAAIERSIGRLESLSRDVRLMALAETKRLVQSTQVADVGPRIASAVQAHQAVAAQRGVKLLPSLPAYPLTVPIDGERFDQVVDNLLSNALKFTPAGGSIEVRLWRAPGGVAVLEIQDSGAGMSEEQQARLFSAFGRPQGSTAPGLGLGLYLCKAIVDGHGGRIGAFSEGPGRGSRFRVELPPGKGDGGRKGRGARQAFEEKPKDVPRVPEGRPPDLPL